MKTKKLMAYALVLYILLCMVQLPVFGSSTPTLSVSNVTARPGRIFEVEINISNNPGIAFLGFDINYDSNAMNLIGVECGDVFPPSAFSPGSTNSTPYSALMYSYFDNSSNGRVLTLTFKLTDKALPIEYDITLSNIEAYTITDDHIIFDSVHGTIQNFIIEPDFTIGDVTGDSIVNGKDLLRLAKYLAGWNVEINEYAADVTGDAKVSSTDLLHLAKYFAGWNIVLEY